jgi:hypothetical protein
MNKVCFRSRGLSGASLLLLALLPALLVLPANAQTRTELAGHDLGGDPADFPHFEYVDAFGDDETLTIAIDPTRFPGVANRFCNIYVVEARSAAEWEADPSLPDPDALGGPLLKAFESDDIQSNTFIVAELDDSLSQAEPCFSVEGETICTGLGVGYDIVLDCAKSRRRVDGVLGKSDFIDGGGGKAGFYVVHDTTRSGLPVVSCLDYEVTDITSGRVRQRTYAPANLEDFEALPIIVVGHGHGHSYDWYDYLQRHLASYGYIVMSHDNDTGGGVLGAALTTLEHTEQLLDVLADPDCENRLLATAGSCIMEEGDPDQPELLDLCSLADKIGVDKYDPDRKIVWVGHSRGGGGVVWALTRLAEGRPEWIDFEPEHYTANNIALVSSIAPSDADDGNGGVSNPGITPYHLIWGAGDFDIGGRPQFPDQMAFQIFERSAGPAQSIYIHGGAHGWFHEACGDIPDLKGCGAAAPNLLADGLTELTEEHIHSITKGYYVPLLKHYLEQSLPAQDYLWRPWSASWPNGSPDAVVALDYRNPRNTDQFVIDDFESGQELSISSSGGTISHDFNEESDIVEALLEDEDCHFDTTREIIVEEAPAHSETCTAADFGATCELPWGQPSTSFIPCELDCGDSDPVLDQPMNGMTRSRPQGEARAIALTWPSDPVPAPQYELEVVSDGRDASNREFLAFRAAQMPRHFYTLEEDSDLSFTVTLRDSLQNSSSIRIDAYDAGIVEPYPRTGPRTGLACKCVGELGEIIDCCNPAGCNTSLSDPGWQAEFEIVRIRLTDFLNNGSDLDLSRIEAVRFEFGGEFGSDVGKIALDDVRFESYATLPDPPLPSCPDVEPCNEYDCLRTGGAIDSLDTDMKVCLPEGTSVPIECQGGKTVHVVTYPCEKAACCLEEPPTCYCRLGDCPSGTYLECE